MVGVTVGLPFLDAERSLADAVRSVFAQTFTDWELLLVDDGSRDGSLEVARRIEDPRVRVLSDGRNRKLPGRLNQIVDEARGEFVARMDADDLMHPDRLARQLRALRESPPTDIVGTACFTLDRLGAVAGVVGAGPISTRPYHVLRRGLLAHATLLCRRSWCLANRYDERFARSEDRELYCRTLGRVVFEHIAAPLYFIGCTKGERATLRDYVESSRDHRRICEEHAPRLVGPWAVAPLVLESFAREAAFAAATALGMQTRLVRSRGRPPQMEEQRVALAALERIRATRVRGLDGPSVHAPDAVNPRARPGT
ncbi:MAG TPA: glycosyltransferase family A protein [Polyangiaceae bacterium]|jgi:glycosyltransferase involved in cell wall biosynthesis